MDPTVGIVVPAYRPDPDQLSRYLTALDDEIEPAALHVELDLPDPGVRELLTATPATVSTADRRRGKGAAVTAGFDRLDTDVLVFTDADGSTPPSSLEAIIRPVQAGAADVAVGSRRHPDAHVRVHQSRIRRRLGDLFVRIAQHMLPVRLFDYQCGAKAIDRATWSTVRERIAATGFAWDIDFLTLAALDGARIEEVPIVWDDHARSTVRPLHTSVEFVRQLLRGWHRSRRHDGSRVHRLIDRVLVEPRPIVREADFGGNDRQSEDP